MFNFHRAASTIRRHSRIRTDGKVQHRSSLLAVGGGRTPTFLTRPVRVGIVTRRACKHSFPSEGRHYSERKKHPKKPTKHNFATAFRVCSFYGLPTHRVSSVDTIPIHKFALAVEGMAEAQVLGIPGERATRCRNATTSTTLFIEVMIVGPRRPHQWGTARVY